MELAQAPVRLHVARGDDRHQNGHSGQAFDQAIGEGVVSLQLGVPPDARGPAEQLPQADLQGPVKTRNPPLLALDEGHVVDMGVADENVVLETHGRSCSFYSFGPAPRAASQRWKRRVNFSINCRSRRFSELTLGPSHVWL